MTRHAASLTKGEGLLEDRTVDALTILRDTHTEFGRLGEHRHIVEFLDRRFEIIDPIDATFQGGEVRVVRGATGLGVASRDEFFHRAHGEGRRP